MSQQLAVPTIERSPGHILHVRMSYMHPNYVLNVPSTYLQIFCPEHCSSDTRSVKISARDTRSVLGAEDHYEGQ